MNRLLLPLNLDLKEYVETIALEEFPVVILLNKLLALLLVAFFISMEQSAHMK